MSLYVDIEKQLGSFHLRVQLETENEITALLGASGCGKSMTLKCIAGIVTPDRGRIVLNDRVLFDSEKKVNLTPQQRKLGYLFQNYALFPNMTVEKNILCGVRSKDKREKAAALADALRRFRLEGLEKRYPAQLSGGQQQRVALARTLVMKPRILLLDEPLSALDGVIKESIKDRIKTIAREYHLTTIIVTHDPEEALTLSDRVLIIDQGSISQYARPDEIVHQPRNDFVRKFILRQLEIKRGNIYALFGDRPQLAGEAV